MNSLQQLVAGCILYLVLALFLMLTNPRSTMSVILIIPFVLLFIANFLVVIPILRKFNSRKVNVNTSMLSNRTRQTSVLIAGFPVILLILQSIGQLTPKDIITSLIIFILIYFYIIRTSSISFPNR
jgi:hypothetical protein